MFIDVYFCDAPPSCSSTSSSGTRFSASLTFLRSHALRVLLRLLRSRRVRVLGLFLRLGLACWAFFVFVNGYFGGALFGFTHVFRVRGEFSFWGSIWGSGSFAEPPPCSSASAPVTRSSPIFSAIAACSDSVALAGVRSGPSLCMPASVRSGSSCSLPSSSLPRSGSPTGLLDGALLRWDQDSVSCMSPLPEVAKGMPSSLSACCSSLQRRLLWVLGVSSAAGGTGLVPCSSSAASTGHLLGSWPVSTTPTTSWQSSVDRSVAGALAQLRRRRAPSRT